MLSRLYAVLGYSKFAPTKILNININTVNTNRMPVNDLRCRTLRQHDSRFFGRSMFANLVIYGIHVIHHLQQDVAGYA